MYERMLIKEKQPSLEEFINYMEAVKPLFLELDQFLCETCGLKRAMRFPYGKSYGWGLKYAQGRKHICDIFAEKGAFNVMLRLSNEDFQAIYDSLHKATQVLIDDRYPCGDGGWIHARILTKEQLADCILLFRKKLNIE